MSSELKDVKPKKSKKKKILLFIGAYVFIGLIVIVTFIIPKINDGSLIVDKNQTNNSDTNSSDEEKEEEIVRINQDVEVGTATYRVNSVEKTTRIEEGLIYTDANETFVIIDLNITNNGNNTMSVKYSDFKLKNGDKTYSPSTGAANFMVDGSQTIYNGINPDSTLSGKVIFDITEEASNSEELVLSIKNKQDIYLNK